MNKDYEEEERNANIFFKNYSEILDRLPSKGELEIKKNTKLRHIEFYDHGRLEISASYDGLFLLGGVIKDGIRATNLKIKTLEKIFNLLHLNI